MFGRRRRGGPPHLQDRHSAGPRRTDPERVECRWFPVSGMSERAEIACDEKIDRAYDQDHADDDEHPVKNRGGNDPDDAGDEEHRCGGEAQTGHEESTRAALFMPQFSVRYSLSKVEFPT